MSANPLTPRTLRGGEVSTEGKDLTRLSIPEGEAGVFRLAQLDDYMHLPRQKFPWQPPLSISLEVRTSQKDLPGTLGFGLWNDPFNFHLGFGSSQFVPALPNAAWFFFASPPNFLSFRDDLPADGMLAATFRSRALPFWAYPLTLLSLPMLLFPPSSRLVRKTISRLIAQDAVQLDLDPTEWHSYRLVWKPKQAAFLIDGQCVFASPVSPYGPLGFVLWIDNQFAAWTPEGRIKYGTLASTSGWIEFKNLSIQPELPE